MGVWRVDGQCACNVIPALGPLHHRLLPAEVAGLYAVGGLVAPAPIDCSIACAATPP